MPNFLIRELDRTSAGNIFSTNHTVLVFGTATETALEKANNDKVIDDNNIIKLSSIADFTNYVGTDQGTPVEVTPNIISYGAQYAYELLRLGYSVLYKVIDTSFNSDTMDYLKDKALYQFRYIVPAIDNTSDDTSNIRTTFYTNIKSIIDGTDQTSVSSMGRGDCIGLFDVTELATKIEDIQNDANISSSYIFWFTPYVYYSNLSKVDSDNFNNTKLPGSFHYFACLAKSLQQYPEWYAVAGYNRGTSDYSISSVTTKLGETAANKLQPRKATTPPVNIILTENDNFYLWGNRTASKSENGLTAENFANIRQLCCTLKKQIYSACRTLIFDPNSDLLWLNFCNTIRPTLERMVSLQGIKDYSFEQLETSIKGKLFAAVRIVPIEAVEDFEIAVTLEDNLDETNVTVEEKLTGEE